MLPSRRLTPFGVELLFDLREPLDKRQAAELIRLFREHKLLLARNQMLDEASHIRVMSLLGPLPSDACSMTSNDPKAGLQGDIKLAFHSDLAFAAEPDLGASLLAIDLVDEASSTQFVNGVEVYRQLPDSLQKRIDQLEALSVWPLDQTRRNRAAALTAADPRARHPIVWNHPATGEPILYLTEMQTDSIVGLPDAESEALIAELFGYLFAPRNILSHRWRKGDLVIYDNLALQHARNDVSQVGVRTLRRVSIARRSFFEQFPQFAPKAGQGFVDARHAEPNAR